MRHSTYSTMYGGGTLKRLPVRLLALLALAGALAGCSRMHGGDPEKGSTAWKIAYARSAGPASITADATVLDYDGSVLAEGTNGWVCMPGMNPADPYPMCNDEVWMKLLHAVMNKQDFTTDRIGISYMLQGDANVSNSDPYATDPANGDVWIREGAHMMIVVPKAMLEGITDDPYSGGPYVMWGGTPYAHIMVPLDEERPAKR